jgi:hypothetical protein
MTATAVMTAALVALGLACGDGSAFTIETTSHRHEPSIGKVRNEQCTQRGGHRRLVSALLSASSFSSSEASKFRSNPVPTNAFVDWNTLVAMDIVLYYYNGESENLYVGAIQEDGLLVPLSVWSLEPVFDSFLEFVVDENDHYGPPKAKTLPLPSQSTCTIIALLDTDDISYGSRQVGGGKGLGNPHGEESELLYYVDSRVLPSNVKLLYKPLLEITW